MTPARSLTGPMRLAILLLFVAAGLFVTWHHELWRDEMQHWAIGLASESPADIFHRLEYENSPPLWHFILFGITRVTQNPFAMQVVHVLIAAITASIVLCWAPFTRLQKILFVFGYYSMFEFCVISRHYVLGPLFLFAFLACFPWQGKRAYIGAAALFLVAQTSLFGLIIALASTVAWLARHFWPPDGAERTPGRHLLVPMSIIGVGGLWSFMQIRPPPETAMHAAWDFLNPWWALRATTLFWRAFVPLPAFRMDFWNSNVLDTFDVLYRSYDLPSLIAQGALSITIVVGSVLMLRRRPDALVLFLVMAGLCMAFFTFKKLGYIRHHAHLYLAWVGALWLLWAQRPAATNGDRRGNGPLRRLSPWVTVLFAVHVVTAAYACITDTLHPFSQAEQTANWIRSEKMQDDVVIAPAVIAPHLEREVFLTEEERFGTYRVWREPYIFFDTQTVIGHAERLNSDHRTPVLLVIHRPLESEDIDEKLQRLAHFGPAIVSDEVFYVYRLREAVTTTPAGAPDDPSAADAPSARARPGSNSTS